MPWLDPQIPGLVDEGRFPVEYVERSPSMTWSDPGPHVQSYVVLLEDLDRGRVHWCLFDIPEKARGIPADASGDVAGGKVATNDLGRVGYSGPLAAPDPGRRFAFRVFALTEKLDLPAGAPASEVLRAMDEKVKQFASRLTFLERVERRRAAA